VIVLDSLLWSQSRFHINGLTVQILGWQSWAFVGVLFAIAVTFESMMAAWVWRWVESRPARQGVTAGILAGLAILGSQLIHAWADATYYVPVTSVAMQLPVYAGFTAKRQFERLGLVDPNTSRERELARRFAAELDPAMARKRAGRTEELLEYPRKPLQCRQEQPLNVLVIMVDAMRSDMLQEATAPFLWRLALERSQWFTQHFSGGNSSRMGMFSFFYGLPPGYWASFEALQRSSVWIDEMQLRGYQMGLFSSSTLNRPVSLDRTAFANVRDLRIRTEPVDAPAWRRDQVVTRQWIEWLRRTERGQPFFGFLLYDAANVESYPEALDDTAGTGAERFARYQKSVRFVDGLIESVLKDLADQGLDTNTLVVITADHGEEFEESGRGLGRHGSGYTREQLQVPLLMMWPGMPPRRFDHRTSHYDVVPTLLKKVMGCSNPAADFAIGRDLFEGIGWDWLIAGSYYNFAVLEPDQITVTYPKGGFEVRDWDYRVVTRPPVSGDVLEAISAANSRYYRK
jgi:membrane-anchored protein YejM (alkaline phosphatase superfamily)